MLLLLSNTNITSWAESKHVSAEVNAPWEARRKAYFESKFASAPVVGIALPSDLEPATWSRTAIWTSSWKLYF